VSWRFPQPRNRLNCAPANSSLSPREPSIEQLSDPIPDEYGDVDIDMPAITESDGSDVEYPDVS
jgi:hypothetical protein